uniref:ribosomal protein S2 n=1 Tax=Chrysotila carterae TaxID=13221 RepID=UPI0022F31239|nr:ribosomal protein S2 [Chrysotila carterae]WAK83150.1 ribosomal protein S2 [Chrysotila carterae]
MAVVTLSELVGAGVHFGHQASRWNPKMFPYIYAEQNGIHVIDLVQTARLLTYACNYVQQASQEKTTFLFVGTKRQASVIVAEEAQKCSAHYINHRWLGGILTNWSTVQKRIEYLKDLDKKEESGFLNSLPKKEAALLRRQHDKLDHNIGGLRQMKKIPDIVIIVDPKREATALLECRKLGIPVIAILDTNCDPNLVDIPIPANDDAVKSIRLILSKLSDSIVQGQNSY